MDIDWQDIGMISEEIGGISAGRSQDRHDISRIEAGYKQDTGVYRLDMDRKDIGRIFCGYR